MSDRRTGIHDAAFLAMNREGKIAPEQKQALINSSASTHGTLLAFLIWGAATVVIVLQFGQPIQRMGRTGEILGMAIIVGVLIVSFLLVAALFRVLERVRWIRVRVQPREGKVEFRNGHYHPTANGKILRSVFNDETSLSPGHYVFYCPHRSSWILSAESTANAAAIAEGKPAAGSAGVDLAEVQRALSLTLGFGAEDLELNRRGRTSRRQRRMLYREIRSEIYGATLGAGFAAALIIYGPVLHPEKPMLPFFVAAGFGALAVAMSLKGLSAGLADVFARSVKSAEGQVGRYTRSSGSGRSSHTVHYYSLGDLNFSVGSAAYEALIEGLTYRVFYLPRTKMLIGIEPISN
ncbi:MAG TPA: hypothetical protein VFM21_10930 [Terriglobia bacterium]|nr:hypothetical protein [Terriglobia bacterium]